jgi:hypothetical protein
MLHDTKNVVSDYAEDTGSCVLVANYLDQSVNS